ncbi:MAG: DUF3592 domain-containing protein [Planctomycetota bacterium]|jgi:hypothetical protein
MAKFGFGRNKDKIKAIAARSGEKAIMNKVVGGIFFLIFGLAGAGMLYPFSIRPILKTIDAQSWQETSCKIISAEVRSHDSDDGTTYSLDILYEYDFNGEKHKSNKYDFIVGSSSGYRGKNKIVKDYIKAKNPVCYVNPNDPSEAVLKRGFGWAHLFCLFPLPFLAVGVGGVTWLIRGKKTVLKSTTEQWTPEIEAEPMGISAYGGDILSGPVVLKPKYSPWLKLLGSIAVAAFWNGMLSVFLIDVLKGFKEGNPEWFLTIFMIPFVAVGIGIIGYIFYQLLSCFNPRPALTLSSANIPLGETAEVKWAFSGRSNIIRDLKITLKGWEEATYRRGTDTVTDKETFYEMEVIQTSNPNSISSGQIGLVIPGDTMHSFEVENNKIIWSIDVHGDIKSWPDVKESFKINIRPATQ